MIKDCRIVMFSKETFPGTTGSRIKYVPSRLTGVTRSMAIKEPTFERTFTDGAHLIAEIVPDNQAAAGPGLHIAVYPTEEDSSVRGMGMVPTANQLKGCMVDLLGWLFENIDQEQE